MRNCLGAILEIVLQDAEVERLKYTFHALWKNMESIYFYYKFAVTVEKKNFFCQANDYAYFFYN